MLAIYIVVFVIMPVLVGFAVYFGHKWRSTLKEAWDEAEKMSREASLKESLKDTLRQAEIRRLEMENTAYSVFNEIQRRNQYGPEWSNTVIDIGVAEVEREEPKGLPDSCGHTERVEKRRQE